MRSWQPGPPDRGRRRAPARCPRHSGRSSPGRYRSPGRCGHRKAARRRPGCRREASGQPHTADLERRSVRTTRDEHHGPAQANRPCRRDHDGASAPGRSRVPRRSRGERCGRRSCRPARPTRRPTRARCGRVGASSRCATAYAIRSRKRGTHTTRWSRTAPDRHPARLLAELVGPVGQGQPEGVALVRGKTACRVRRRNRGTALQSLDPAVPDHLGLRDPGSARSPRTPGPAAEHTCRPGRPPRAATSFGHAVRR